MTIDKGPMTNVKRLFPSVFGLFPHGINTKSDGITPFPSVFGSFPSRMSSFPYEIALFPSVFGPFPYGIDLFPYVFGLFPYGINSKSRGKMLSRTVVEKRKYKKNKLMPKFERRLHRHPRIHFQGCFTKN